MAQLCCFSTLQKFLPSKQEVGTKWILQSDTEISFAPNLWATTPKDVHPMQLEYNTMKLNIKN